MKQSIMGENLETKAILGELVRIETVSGCSTNEINDLINKYCEQSCDAKIIASGPNKTQKNIAFRFGPDVPGGIILSGHTDVVPVQDQKWSHPPFDATERDGRIYGRGTCDMKGFLASMIASVPKLDMTKLVRPIWLAFTYDEETGCLGAPYLAKEIVKNSSGIKAVIVGEPTEMTIVDQHKGAFVEYVTFHGLSVHSSLPWLGLSATEYAIRFGAQLVALSEEFSKEVTVTDADRMTTLNLAQINGGTAHNIVPDKCRVMWSLRCAPGQDANAIVTRIRAIARSLEAEMQNHAFKTSVEFETIFDVPPLAAKPDSPALHLGLGMTGQNAAQSVNYGTEAGVYQNVGLPTIICGPGSIEQAHKPDEWISIEQLDACDKFIEKLIANQSV
ncbi:acetylornithine deacetylase [Pseudopelagicola sp. nBUS_20]|uniref:acetylornithine deacetylase n=1 Tax=Pseudopelagicola sp. nBUS_20 TaxID=3395317 RepID=UPI003EBB2386